MRQFLIALFSGLIIAAAADEVLYGGANTVIPAKVAGSNAVNQFNYQLSLLLSKVP
ncbi:MAG TPA: hypothetical protein VN938_10325 [Xanthobacteraceae bacterium]|jgi:hypothetical protein|nr:hypothetical protein [Xanthobacteraceae bacterium]